MLVKIIFPTMCAKLTSLELLFLSLQHTLKIFVVSLILCASLSATPASSEERIFKRGVVACKNQYAGKIGASVLAEGGNAIDAAVAVGYALAVAEPNGSGLGGGGFALIYLRNSDRLRAIDFRERAPDGVEADFDIELNGARAGGIPGSVAGFEYMRETYGSKKLNRARLINPAIRLAAQGIPVEGMLRHSLTSSADKLAGFATSNIIFGDALKKGVLVQEDLAETLSSIADAGASVFYRGSIAQTIAATLAKDGGIIDSGDLASYRVRELTPICGSYRGRNLICSLPPPSSGGVCLLQALNLLERLSLGDMQFNSAERIAAIARALQKVFAFRAEHLGDPIYNRIPYGEYIKKQFIRSELGELSHPKESLQDEQPETTHYTVADAYGNIAAVTVSLNGAFGSGYTISGTGILLNNTLDDFAKSAGRPNQYGMLGNHLNSIAPGKTPLSSMTPTIVFDKRTQRPLLALGSPGGPTIISAVLNVLIAYLDHGMSLEQALVAGRVHHQWKPAVLSFDGGLIDDSNVAALRNYGFKIDREGRGGGGEFYWAVQAISMDEATRELKGASDPRFEDGTTYEHQFSDVY